ncbi:MAG: response regulator, partial [Cyanobacteria bacterium]|nr:response regulator [Cyanobacteriota bacterium]
EAVVTSVADDPNIPRGHQASQVGLRSGFAFPIKSRGEVLGVCEFFADRVMAIDEHQLRTYELVGQEIGQLIDRLRSSAKLEESERKFKAIFDQTYEFIGLLSPDGILLDANRTALEFVGAKAGDVIGKHFWETPWWTHSGELQETLKAAIKKAASGEFIRFESTHPSPDGSVRHFDVSIKPIFDGVGKVVLLIPEGRDMSEKREAEQRVSEFYSTVSHELRTPLTSIRGSLGLIEGGLTGTLSEKTLRLIKIARTESDRLIRLINDILDLRKIEAGMLELKKTTIESQLLVQRTIDGIRGMAESNGISLAAELNTAGPVFCDEDRVIQVLTNLASNAIKFSDHGGDVILRLDPGSGNTFRFSIIDHGMGIPKEQMHKLFGRFQQIDQSDRRQKEGTGLGLAITKAIVEDHGGQICVESEVGKGSTFWFELPATFTPVSTVTQESGPLTHVRPALIVEDDNNIAEILTAHLVANGFEVVHVQTLAEARERLTRYKPLIVLLDLTLPDGNGLDLLSSLNSDEYKDVPVVIITAMERDGAVTISHPVLIDWITKPFNETRLQNALDRAREQIGLAQVLVVEDDPATREILKQHLESLGVDCLEASNGVEALEAFRKSNPDLVILDITIPQPDGFAVVDTLRKEANGMKPLIVYTALDLTESQKSELKLGITAHLTKSAASPEQLTDTIREFLDGLLLRKPKDQLAIVDQSDETTTYRRKAAHELRET